MSPWKASAELEKENDGKHEIWLSIVGVVSFPTAVVLVTLVLYAVQEGWFK